MKYYKEAPYVNDTSKPVIFLGSNSILEIHTELCENLGIEVRGIIDSDYYGNTKEIAGVPVIDTEEALLDPLKANYYREQFNFFCVVNWLPMTDAATVRNKEKRKKLIDIAEKMELQFISLVDKNALLSKYTKIGRGVHVGVHAYTEPHVTIGDHTTLQGAAVIGHHVNIGKNCVLQRMVAISGGCNVGDNCYFGVGSAVTRVERNIGSGTFLYSNTQVRRHTLENEVVSLTGGNTKGVFAGNSA